MRRFKMALKSYLGIGASWLIIVLIICMPGTFVVTYVIAVLVGHVRPLWPYISDTGTLPPESCIFGQMLNVGSVIVGLIVYIRYHIVKRCFVDTSFRLRDGNLASLVCGFLSAVGLTLVGNFQATNVKSIHYLGAVMAFGCGVVYIVINSVLSFWLIPTLNSYAVFGIRITCCFISTAALICTFAGSQVFYERHRYYEQQYLLSTIAEWAMSVTFVVFFATFIPEFKHVKLQLPVVKHLDPVVT